MSSKKYVKDIMISTANLPYMPSSFSLRQAIEVMRSMASSAIGFQSITALVFGERGLAGTLELKDILKGLEPGFLTPSIGMHGFSVELDELSVLWDDIFDEESKRLAERTLDEVMRPITATVKASDSILTAAYLMNRDNASILPVIGDDNKIIGMVRINEVFDALAGKILTKSRPNLRIVSSGENGATSGSIYYN